MWSLGLTVHQTAEAVAGPSVTKKARPSIGSSMSQGSKADYSVYTMSCGQRTKVVAIVDAKKPITPHSVAQVIGYYSTFKVNEPRPIVLILTSLELKIVMFPFISGGEPLVNAVQWKEFQLWKSEVVGESEVDKSEVLDMGVLQLLLSLMDNKSVLRNYALEVNDSVIPINAQVAKSRISNIVSNKAKIEELEESYRKLNQESKRYKKRAEAEIKKANNNARDAKKRAEEEIKKANNNARDTKKRADEEIKTTLGMLRRSVRSLKGN